MKIHPCFPTLPRLTWLVASVFLFCTLGYPAVASAWWVKRYNGPGKTDDGANAITVDGGGNVYVTGWSNGTSSAADYATIKYDKNGSQQWVRRYNGPGNDNDAASAIAVDGNGNVYVTGYSVGESSLSDYATIKYDTNGNQKWVRRYNGSGNMYDEASAIAVDGSGNVYVTGSSEGPSLNPDYVTIKYDTNGNRKWVKRYNSPYNKTDRATAIAVDWSGNVYVTGDSSRGINSYYATIKYDKYGNQKWVKGYHSLDGLAKAITVDGSGSVYVTGWSSHNNYTTIKYDTNGNTKWLRTYSRGLHNYAKTIALDGSRNVYVTGSSDGASGYRSDYATIKYDTNGNRKWVKCYNHTGKYDDMANAIAVDGGGNVYVTGVSHQISYVSDYATIKYDTNGNEKWVRFYNGPDDSFDDANAIAVDGGGNVYVTGWSYGTSSSYDSATIKYDTNGK
jgi:hypothetical protein